MSGYVASKWDTRFFIQILKLLDYSKALIEKSRYLFDIQGMNYTEQ